MKRKKKKEIQWIILVVTRNIKNNEGSCEAVFFYMNEKRNFLNKLLGAFENPTKKSSVNKDTANEMPSVESRRSFLKKVAVGAAAVALKSDFFPDSVRAQSAQERNESTPESAEFEALYEDLQKYNEEVQKKSGGLSGRGMKDFDTIRANFLSTDFPGKLPHMFALAKQVGDAQLLKNLVGMLGNFSAQGLLFAEAKKQTGLPLHEVMEFKKNYYYYGAKLCDFSPAVEDIQDNDIDPRLNLVEGLPFSSMVEGDIEDYPGWADPERRQVFRDFVANEKIQTLAKQADLTMVEYFSLIKSVIDNREGFVISPDVLTKLKEVTLELFEEKATARPHVGQSDELAAQLLLEQRDLFIKKSFLGSHTKHFIQFTGYDKLENGQMLFNPQKWEDVARAAGVAEEAIVRVDAADEYDDSMKKKYILSQIGASSGDTFVSFAMHGIKGGDGMMVNKFNKNFAFVSDEHIASALIDRVDATKDYQTLSQLTLCFDSCFSYNFSKNIIERMREIWKTKGYEAKVSFEKVSLPTIITVAQEGSPGIANHTYGELLQRQLGGIIKDGAVTGKRLSQVVQPIAYPMSDMTFFNGQQGKLLEFGGIEKPVKNVTV